MSSKCMAQRYLDTMVGSELTSDERIRFAWGMSDIKPTIKESGSTFVYPDLSTLVFEQEGAYPKAHKNAKV